MLTEMGHGSKESAAGRRWPDCSALPPPPEPTAGTRLPVPAPPAAGLRVLALTGLLPDDLVYPQRGETPVLLEEPRPEHADGLLPRVAERAQAVVLADED